MLYSLARPLLFRLDAETAHHTTLNALKFLNDYGLDGFYPKPLSCPVNVMGLSFPNPVGLAAGLDKNGEYIDALAAMGFGFIEIGTVTPRPQPGNAKPRLFRLPPAEAIINRMGFNNDGVDVLVDNVKKARYDGILGINIGKNATTPIENAVDDYLICLNKVYPHASYITVNISSPNTKNLRDLQAADTLSHLLSTLRMRQLELADHYGRYVPLAVKIAPDLDLESIADMAERIADSRIDAVIATNTTLSRDGVLHLPTAAETGGLSGAPLTGKSTLVIRELASQLDGRIPVIGVGGIMRGDNAWEKFDAGAQLVQVYSGLIYKGPALVRDCVSAAQVYFNDHPDRRVARMPPASATYDTSAGDAPTDTAPPADETAAPAPATEQPTPKGPAPTQAP